MLQWLNINVLHFKNNILKNDILSIESNEYNELFDYIYKEDIYFKDCIDEMKENGMSTANAVFRLNHEENRNDLRQNQFGGGKKNIPIIILIFTLFYTMMVSSIHLPSMTSSIHLPTIIQTIRSNPDIRNVRKVLEIPNSMKKTASTSMNMVENSLQGEYVDALENLRKLFVEVNKINDVANRRLDFLPSLSTKIFKILNINQGIHLSLEIYQSYMDRKPIEFFHNIARLGLISFKIIPVINDKRIKILSRILSIEKVKTFLTGEKQALFVGKKIYSDVSLVLFYGELSTLVLRHAWNELQKVEPNMLEDLYGGNKSRYNKPRMNRTIRQRKRYSKISRKYK